MPVQPLQYEISFAGISFISDNAIPYNPPTELNPAQDRQKNLYSLVDEINRRMDFGNINTFSSTPHFPGKNLSSLAVKWIDFCSQVRVGEWHYPTGATRWSVFRGLATSSQYKAMLEATTGNAPKTFRMRCDPVSPNTQNSSYLLETEMYLLEGRCLAEYGKEFDGVWLITLVDERYFWNTNSVTLHPNQNTTWDDLIDSIADIVTVEISYSSISSNYSVPEIDSQFWVNEESAAVLLDAVASNIGRVVCRRLNGTYVLRTAAESVALVESNRGNPDKVARLAGGEFFVSGTMTRVGNTCLAKNAFIPSTVTVTYPLYVTGDDPVPHFLNSRYAPQRASVWTEDSFGSVWSVTIPITSGGPYVSGLVGINSLYSIRDTAKALLFAESDESPGNLNDLELLARQIAYDYYSWQAGAALDETYPGTYAWEPEGFHDILWKISEKTRTGSTRVFRTEWNATPLEMQHSCPPRENQTGIARGVGGKSVPQTWRDSLISGSVSSTLTGNIASGVYSPFGISNPTIFPQDYRWKGLIGNETVLFEGLSGGNSAIPVFRGLDGSLSASHSLGDSIYQKLPNTVFGTNLVTGRRGVLVSQGAMTSGGICEAIIDIGNPPPVSGGAGSGNTFNFYNSIWNLYENQFNYYSGNNFNFGLSGQVSGGTDNFFFYNPTNVTLFQTLTYDAASGVPVVYNTVVGFNNVPYYGIYDATWSGYRNDEPFHQKAEWRVVVPDPPGVATLTGIVGEGVADGSRVVLLNEGPGRLDVTHLDSAHSASGNMFDLPGETTFSLLEAESVEMVRDAKADEANWKVISTMEGGGGGGGGDIYVKVTATDTTTNYLASKTVAGTGIVLGVTNPGADEKLSISLAAQSILWVKYTITAAQVAALGAVLTGSIDVATLPAGTSFHGSYGVTRTAFDIFDLNADFGYPTDVNFFWGGFGLAGATDTYFNTGTPVYPTMVDLGVGTTTLRVTLTASVAFNTCTAGILQVWVAFATLAP